MIEFKVLYKYYPILQFINKLRYICVDRRDHIARGPRIPSLSWSTDFLLIYCTQELRTELSIMNTD